MTDPENELRKSEPAFQLGELLAVIHRDGGQYLNTHGVVKATDDAIKIIHALRTPAKDPLAWFDT